MMIRKDVFLVFFIAGLSLLTLLGTIWVWTLAVSPF